MINNIYQLFRTCAFSSSEYGYSCKEVLLTIDYCRFKMVDSQIDVQCVALSTSSSVPVPKLSKLSSLPKQSSTKPLAKMATTMKKTAQKSAVKQSAGAKAVKAVTKALGSVKTAPAPALIVSLPFASLGQHVTSPVRPQLVAVGGAGGESVAGASPTIPAVLEVAQKQRTPFSSSSNSSSSSSSSDSDSDDSASHSSSSDREGEPMDTSLPHPPPPPLSTLPKMVDKSPVTGQPGTKVIQPKPIPSPVKIVAPNQLTSLALVSPTGIPLISPLSSPADKQVGKTGQTTYALTATRQGSLELVPITTALASSTSKVLASLTTKPSGVSAFHVVTTTTSQQLPSGIGTASTSSSSTSRNT